MSCFHLFFTSLLRKLSHLSLFFFFRPLRFDICVAVINVPAVKEDEKFSIVLSRAYCKAIHDYLKIDLDKIISSLMGDTANSAQATNNDLASLSSAYDPNTSCIYNFTLTRGLITEERIKGKKEIPPLDFDVVDEVIKQAFVNDSYKDSDDDDDIDNDNREWNTITLPRIVDLALDDGLHCITPNGDIIKEGDCIVGAAYLINETDEYETTAAQLYGCWKANKDTPPGDTSLLLPDDFPDQNGIIIKGSHSTKRWNFDSGSYIFRNFVSRARSFYTNNKNSKITPRLILLIDSRTGCRAQTGRCLM